MKDIEHCSLYKPCVFLANIHGLELSFEYYSLTATWFYKEFCAIHFYFDVCICWKCNIQYWLHCQRYQKRMATKSLAFWHFLQTFAWFFYICHKTQSSSFKYQNENIQIFQMNQFWKSSVNKWLLFKSYF